MHRVRIIGRGRAGTSMAGALRRAGWEVDGPIAHDGAGVRTAAAGVELLLLAVPDAAVAAVAAAVDPDPGCAVAHLAGSLTLDVLAPHPRRASIHPLVALPGGDLGAARLSSGAWFAVAGDPDAATVAASVVDALGGRTVDVADEDRVRYHAAAVMASNHLVALLGEVEQVAASCGVPLEAYLELVRGTVDNVAALGPRAALTGPVARGDGATVARHLAALPEPQAAVYAALSGAAERLVARTAPA